MPGKKLFTNTSPYKLRVTLEIRKSSDPRDRAGTKEFELQPQQSQWQEYGDNVNIYLNGIRLTAVFNGEKIGQQFIVITRGSRLDNELNMKNGVRFAYDRNVFNISTYQTR